MMCSLLMLSGRKSSIFKSSSSSSAMRVRCNCVMLYDKVLYIF